MLYLFGKKLGTQHYPTVAGVGYTTPTYEIMDVGCWVHNNQLYKSWLLGTQQPTNFRRCVVLCWFLLVQPMSAHTFLSQWLLKLARIIFVARHIQQSIAAVSARKLC